MHKNKGKPKIEWQYITFLQKMSREQSNLSKNKLMIQWKKLQAEKATQAFDILERVKKKSE